MMTMMMITVLVSVLIQNTCRSESDI